MASSDDGTPFAAPSTPTTPELDHYEVFRAAAPPNWTAIAPNVPRTTTQFTDNTLHDGDHYFYRVDAVDAEGLRESSLMVDTSRTLYVYSQDNVTRLEVPPELVRELTAAGNKYGADNSVYAARILWQTPNRQ